MVHSFSQYHTSVDRSEFQNRMWDTLLESPRKTLGQGQGQRFSLILVHYWLKIVIQKVNLIKLSLSHRILNFSLSSFTEYPRKLGMLPIPSDEVLKDYAFLEVMKAISCAEDSYRWCIRVGLLPNVVLCRTCQGKMTLVIARKSWRCYKKSSTSYIFFD